MSLRNVLIINLTRMGDLIQTTPVMAALKKAHPGVRITLAVSNNFAGICQLMRYVDRLVTFPVTDLVQMLHEGGTRLVHAYRLIESILGEINDTVYDMTLNFTHSSDSMVLTTLVNTVEIRGATMDGRGHVSKRYPWMQYFFNVIPCRRDNPFHLCDIYLRAACPAPAERGLILDVSQEVGDRVSEMLAARGVTENDTLIGLQLGASAEDKRWPVRSFAEVADRLAACGTRIVLTGSKGEACHGEEFTSIAKTDPLNFIGRTNLEDLAGLIKRCNLFISNDTGPLHIATAVGTTTINVSMASVNFRETGPYGDGHYVIAPEAPCFPCDFGTQCGDPVCKSMVRADQVSELARCILAGETLDREAPELWRSAQVYRTSFGTDGFIDYEPLIQRPLRADDIYRMIFRKTWPVILEESDGVIDIGDILSHVEKRHGPGSGLPVIDALDNDRRSFAQLMTLAQEGSLRASLIAREGAKSVPDALWLKDEVARLSEIDREIEIMGSAHPPLKPLTVMFRYGKEALGELGLAPVASETRDLYGRLGMHASLVLQVIGGLAGSRQDADRRQESSVCVQ